MPVWLLSLCSSSCLWLWSEEITPVGDRSLLFTPSLSTTRIDSSGYQMISHTKDQSEGHSVFSRKGYLVADTQIQCNGVIKTPGRISAYHFSGLAPLVSSIGPEPFLSNVLLSHVYIWPGRPVAPKSLPQFYLWGGSDKSTKNILFFLPSEMGVLFSLVRPWTCYVAEGDLKLLISLSESPEFWN